MKNGSALRKNIVAYTPFIIFGIPVVWIAVWFAIPSDIAESLNSPFDIVSKVSTLLQQSIDMKGHTHVCTPTLPRVLALLYIAMFLCLVWVITLWLVVHTGRTPNTLKDMSESHYLQSELWFSILLMTIIFSFSIALSNVFYIRCDSSVMERLREISGWNNVWIVVVEHGMPLLAFNTFAFTAILLGFLWSRQSYTAHSHNNIIFGYKATYWEMIEASMGQRPPEIPHEQWINLRADLFKEVMKVSPASGYGEGTQAIQLVGISGGEAIMHGTKGH